MRRAYYTLDVFAAEPLAGNPLAVVIDSAGLKPARMQQVAREFNLSATAFVSEPRDPVNTAALRIFTIDEELRFGTHATIGAAVLIAQLRAADLLKNEDVRVVLETKIGEVVCVVRHRHGEGPAAYLHLPRLPKKVVGDPGDASHFAGAISLQDEDMGFDEHEPTAFDAGTPLLFIPVNSLDAVARAEGGGGTLWNQDIYVYTRETVDPDADFHTRLFTPDGWGITELPASGAAAAAFAGVLMAFEKPPEGESMVVIEQGYEMGRPSRISLGLKVEAGKLVDATVGGYARIVCQGTIDV